MLVHCCFFLFHLWIVFCLYFSCRYKLHQHTCIWTLWSYIFLICSILSWHSYHITIPYLWPKFQRQIIHLPSWSSGQSLVINGNWISMILHFLSLSGKIFSISPGSFFYLPGSAPLFLVYLVWLLVLSIV